MKPLKPHHFTLIELLIAIALTMVLGWLISLAFSNTSQASKTVTSTLDLHSKGRMIMEQIASDIMNTVQTSSHVYTIDKKEIRLKTHLMRLRSRYGSGNFGEAKNYPSDVVAVRWKFFDNTDTLPSGVQKLSLYRQIAPLPTMIDDNDRNAKMDALLGVSGTLPNLVAADLVTAGDIRDFKIEPSAQSYAVIGSGAGTIPEYYTVSFYLTNAPPEKIANRAADPDSDYMWVFCKRVVRTR